MMGQEQYQIATTCTYETNEILLTASTLSCNKGKHATHK